MGTKTVVETKKKFEISYLPDLRRLLRIFALFLAVLSPIILSYFFYPSNIVVGTITFVSYGVIALFGFQTIYGLILVRRYFL
ncbi:hypothetical protein CEE45_05865 [Candidatus Heimdallarchaeota archaeon B3_Heim]|nr:MAG: hypothetical protein CEE45_05865 [Candidatus Heimdallarchaeota archaeon B3_Heim]